jgi:membrane-bound lytic murein transglycosylase D
MILLPEDSVQRLLPLLLLALWVVPTATAQDQPASSSSSDVTLQRTDNKPPEAIPHAVAIERSRKLLGLTAMPPDSLTQEEILQRISRLYRYQADILAAEAEGDHEHAEGLLELAMTELGTLAQQPGVMERPRFRELYRTVVTEYERYYGVPDTSLVLPYGDLFQLRADVFAALNEVDEPLLEDVMLPELTPVDVTVPMTTNRLVERSVQFLLEKRKDTVKRWLNRADTYFPMVEQIFREEGVPDELKYLAVIESGLNPRARSWAQAVGMWQFIAATGRAYGLDVNTWVDERMDPEKATLAAARHLKDLYAMYDQDWHIALAGYNCSPRCIKRAIRRANTDDPTFWDIYPYLPRETRNYVPMYIAATLVLSNPTAFGIERSQRGPQYAYDLVPVQGMIALRTIAEMAGTDLATLRALNPELRRNTLPPTRDGYMLRIPKGSYPQFAEAYETLPDDKKRPIGEYVVRRGDSLGKIGTRFGLSVRALMRANGLRSTVIHPGQRLAVPVPDYDDGVVLADAEPKTIEYGQRIVRPISPLEPLARQEQRDEAEEQATPVVKASTRAADDAEATPDGANAEAGAADAEANADGEAEEPEAETTETRIVYRVRRGDTLAEIAQKYSVSVSDLKEWNNLRGSRIYSGQKLYLYSSSVRQPEKVVYRVRRGDNLTEIAKKYDVSVRSVRQWNSLRGSRIYPGQRLTIHPGQDAPRYTIHRVRRGDNLTKIARRYGVSIRKIRDWNSLRGSRIYPGQRLKIYQ